MDVLTDAVSSPFELRVMHSDQDISYRHLMFRDLNPTCECLSPHQLQQVYNTFMDLLWCPQVARN